MIFFHLCEHDSFRDLKQSMTDQMSEILPDISLATLSNHNNNRDYRVFLPVMQDLIDTCVSTLTKDERLKKFGSVKMIDSTTISMCLRFFAWAVNTNSLLNSHLDTFIGKIIELIKM